MKKLVVLTVLCCICSFLNAQTITSVEYSVNWQSATTPVPVAGKGIYVLVKEGLVLFDPATTKYKLFNQNDSNKTIAGLKGLTAYKDKLVAYSDDKLYLLLPNGLLKDMTPPYKFGGYDLIRHVIISENEITATSGDKIFSYQKNEWKQVPVPDLRNTKFTKISPAGNKYLGIKEGSINLVLYDPETKTERELARTYDSPIFFRPDQAAAWFLLDDGIEYFAFKNRVIYSSFDVKNYPGKTKLTLQNTKAFDGCRLIAGDKQDIYFISADTAIQLSTTPVSVSKSAVDTFIRMVLQKARLKPAFPKTGSEFVVYENTVYEIGGPGIVTRTLQKTDTLYKLVNRSIGMEGYNWMMPNGYLYTRDATKLYWNNGNTGGSAEFRNYVLDITTDGKTNYLLTEKILYKEKSTGIFDSVASASENSMKAVAVDKNGIIWMASNKGITIVSNGQTEFIPASSIRGFPKNQAVHDIAVSPENEIYISLGKVYKYHDKIMTEIPKSPSLVYCHYFDGQGNDYMAGNGECYFYDGKEAKDIKKILQEAYPGKKNPYVGAVTIDQQGRCWAIASFLNQKGIVVFDKGKPVNFISDERVILDPYKQRIFFYKQQMIIATEKGGWTTLQYK
jgi:hypothetical protein